MSQKNFRLLTSILILSILFTLPAQPTQAGQNAPNNLPDSPNWSGQSDNLAGNFGWQAAPAGDVNGDHIQDLLVGAPSLETSTTITDTGAAYVYCGSSQGLAADPIGTSNGYPSWWVYGEQHQGRFGANVIGIGNVNGDQFDDIAISLPNYTGGGQSGEGKVYVWYGAADFCTRLGEPLSSASWSAELDQIGANLNAITGDDVNGDGFSDLIVGAQSYDDYNPLDGTIPDTGAVFVWLGSAQGLNGNGVPGTPANAFWKAFGGQMNDRIGYRVAAVDVKHDGQADIIASSIWYHNGQVCEGAVFAWYNHQSPGIYYTTNADWRIESNQENASKTDGARLGGSLAAAGDVNGDNTPDLIVSAYLYNHGQEREGMAFVFHGSASGLPGSGTPGSWQDVYATANWKVETNRAYSHLGYSLSGSAVGAAGDVNTDGYDDVVVGEAFYDFTGGTDRGKVYMFHGSSSGLSCGPNGAPCPIDAGDANWGVTGDQDNAQLGYSVAGMGDVNGDHVSDVIVGAPFYNTNVDDGGKVFAYYGIKQNTPPVAVNDVALPGYEDTVLVVPANTGLLVNDYDPGGNNNRLSAIYDAAHLLPAHGAVVISANGAYTYTPDLNWSGTDTFRYFVTDSFDRSPSAIVTVTISAANDAPVAVANNYTVNEDATLAVNAPGILGNDTDVEGNPLTAMLDTNVSHGTLTLNANGSFTYVPTANYSSSDSFTYHARDGAANSNTATVSITIIPVNDAPSAVNDAASTALDTSRTIAVLGNDSDPDGDTLSVATATDPPHGSVVNNGSNVTYTPDPGTTGTDTFNYTCSDNQGGTATAQVTVNVGNVNDPPTATNDTALTAEDTAAVLSVLANDTDPDADTLSIVNLTQPAHGTAVIEVATVRYTPAANYHGPDSFTYKASDGQALSGVATVNITVTPVNDPPAAGDDSAGTTIDTPVTIGVLANDTDMDGDSLSVSQVSLPAHGTATISGTNILYTPTSGYDGADTFTYTVSDDQGGSDTATVNITIRSTNTTPVAVDDNATTLQGASVTITVLENDSDADSDPLSVTQISIPAHGTAVINGTQVIYTPAPGYTGSDAFTYTISDGFASATATVTVDVMPTSSSYPVFLPLLVR